MAVCILTTGGTIASTPQGPHGVVAQVPGTAFRQWLGDSSPGIEVEELTLQGSYNFDLAFVNQLIRAIHQVAQREAVEGIVVTQGTDTMEETAFAAHVLNRSHLPVVFTGAQRAAHTPDADGPRNLLHAVQVARHEAFRQARSLIVFGGEIVSGLWAVKAHTSRLQPYESLTGKLGMIEDDGHIKVLSSDPSAMRYEALESQWEPSVVVVPMMLGLSGEVLWRLMEGGIKGFVLEAFGLGNANRSVVDAVGALTQRQIPVVVTSRCRHGGVRPVYGNGGGVDLAHQGAIFAGYLPASKARMLLALLLGNHVPVDDIPSYFIEFQ